MHVTQLDNCCSMARYSHDLPRHISFSKRIHREIVSKAIENASLEALKGVEARQTSQTFPVSYFLLILRLFVDET